MSTAISNFPMAIKGRGVNLRVVLTVMLFVAAILAPLGLFLWPAIEQAMTGGIVDRGDYVFADLKTISSFEMDQFEATEESIPKRFRELDGKRVMLKGEMYSPYVASGTLAGFDLVYSISKCCVTPSPKVQHFIKCTVMPGKVAPYRPGVVKVTGMLHVGVEREGGRVASVYRMDVEKVEAD